MFSFFTRPTTGIAFGNTSVRVAQGALKSGALTLLDHAEEPLRDAERETIPIAENLKTALAKVTAASHLSFKRSMLLLPEDRVYTQMFVFAPSSKKNLPAFVNDAVARTIPEPFSTLRIFQKILQDSAERIEVGIAAVRGDALQSYREASSLQGGRLLSGTTASYAIVAAHADPKPTSFLLVHESTQQVTVTLFHRLWAVDEAVLPLPASPEVILRTAESLAAEYREQGLEIGKIFFAGSWDNMTLPPDATLSTETLFPEFADRSWIGVTCASVADPAKFALNFIA